MPILDPDFPRHLPSLYIETNHGHVKMTDVTLEERTDGRYAYVNCKGTCVSSSETSRLFWATSTRQMFEPGAVCEYSIWRQPYGNDEIGYRASVVSCG